MVISERIRPERGIVGVERDEKNLALEEAKTRLKKVANKKMTLEEFDVWFYGELSLEIREYLESPPSSMERDTRLVILRKGIETEKRVMEISRIR